MFNHQTKTITFAAFLLGLSGLISRLLGLVRDRLLASQFGAGEKLDIYFSAFRIPDFVYGILIVGGITAAFLPLFSEYFQRKEIEQNEEGDGNWPQSALDFVNNVLNSFLISLVVICGILAIFTPYIIHLVVPGFSPANRDLTIALTRIMFLSPILFGISSIFSGVLQYFNRFLAYSLAPILYNVGIIFGILCLVPIFGIYGLAFGVILGALLHFLIQIPAAIKAGFKYNVFLDLRHSGLLRIFKLTIPRIIGTAADQINLIVITALASALAVGSIAIFNFSNNIQAFPAGIIGVSFAISSFPVFSRFLANGQKKEFLEHFSSSFRQILYFIIPLLFSIFLLRAQIIRLILGVGKFDWDATRLTAACLGLFCIGILAESLIPLISRAFFSFQDTKTPMIVGTLSVIINIIACVLFVFLLGFHNSFQQFSIGLLKLQGIKGIEVVGLPLGFSLASAIQLILLLIFLYKKIGDFEIKKILISLVKILIAGFLMSGAVYLILHLVVYLNWVDMKTFFGVFWQTILAAGGGAITYLLATYILRSPEIKTIKTSLLHLK